MVYVRFNLDHARGVSRSLAAKSPGSSRQPGKEQGVGRNMWPRNGECAAGGRPAARQVWSAEY